MALSKRSGDKVRLELTKDVDSLIADYLREVFVLRRGDETAQLLWIGKEVSVKTAWLYFELEIPSGGPSPEGVNGTLELRQTLFFELEATQVNTVHFRRGTGRTTLTFHREQPSVPISDGEQAQDPEQPSSA